MHYVTLGTV